MKYNWYVLHTFSSKEDKVKGLIEREKERWEDGYKIRKVVVPMVEMAEQRGGKKRVVKKKLIPRYVFLEIEIEKDDQLMRKIRNLPDIVGFVSSGIEPQAMTEDEVASIFAETDMGDLEKREQDIENEKSVVRILFHEEESVKVIDGPFTNFQGVVKRITPATGEIQVDIEIFGKSTPVSLDYLQIEKI